MHFVQISGEILYIFTYSSSMPWLEEKAAIVFGVSGNLQIILFWLFVKLLWHSVFKCIYISQLMSRWSFKVPFNSKCQRLICFYNCIFIRMEHVAWYKLVPLSKAFVDTQLLLIPVCTIYQVFQFWWFY